MGRKRRSKDDEIGLEVERLDDALDELVAQLNCSLPMADDQPQVAALQAKLRREAAQAIAVVSERKASLLGLDAATGKNAPTDSGIRPGSIAELEQKLALVEKNRAS